MTATSSFRSRAAEATAARLRRLPRTTSSHELAAVRIARVPFVVEKINVSARGADVEARDLERAALTGKDPLGEGVAQRARFLDLAAAKDSTVARGSGLCD